MYFIYIHGETHLIMFITAKKEVKGCVAMNTYLKLVEITQKQHLKQEHAHVPHIGRTTM
jgi:hypothetical protein